MPARMSLDLGALPIGLAHHVTLIRDVPAGGTVRFADVELPDSQALTLRREAEKWCDM